jgi:predicted nucleic acid-binding protein
MNRAPHWRTNVLVVDASVLASILVDGGSAGSTGRKAVVGHRLIAPDLIHLEVLSVLRRRLSGRKLTARRAGAALEDLIDWPIETAPITPLLQRCWSLRSNLSSYDASYVALAESLDCPLITSDRRLANAPGSRCEFIVVTVSTD